jgi:hypothetical protein
MRLTAVVYQFLEQNPICDTKQRQRNTQLYIMFWFLLKIARDLRGERRNSFLLNEILVSHFKVDTNHSSFKFMRLIDHYSLFLPPYL